MRNYQLTLALVGILFFSCSKKESKSAVESDKSQSKKRPNIVFIMSDDHAYQTL